jgi:hypothetical protein
LSERVFIVMRSRSIGPGSGNHMLFLIECKSPGDKVQRWFESMTPSAFEKVTLAKGGRSRHFLVRVAGHNIGPATELFPFGKSFGIVGIYQATEDDAG